MTRRRGVFSVCVCEGAGRLLVVLSIIPERKTEMSDQNQEVKDTQEVSEVSANDAENAAAVDGKSADQAVEAEIISDEEIPEEISKQSETSDAGAESAAEAAPAESEEKKPAEVDWKDAYIRQAADYDNFRKRTAKEQEEIRTRERNRVIRAWLEVYDNAERAVAQLPEKEGPWYEGFTSLIAQMDKCLASFNIKPADDLGKPFDPKRHEAVAILPNPAMENNTIMHVESRGFVYENGEVARVARVIVVKNPS